MVEKNIKTEVIEDLLKCIKIKDEILSDGITKNNIEKLQTNHRSFEIESPLTGETMADWIRINYNGVYVFIHLDNENKPSGNYWYQLDYIGSYGLELIWTETITDFMKNLMKLTEAEILETIF